MPTCYVCKTVYPVNILREHFKIEHEFDASNKYNCAEELCSRFYSTYYSLERHWRTEHAELDLIESNAVHSTSIFTCEEVSNPVVGTLLAQTSLKDQESCEIFKENSSSPFVSDYSKKKSAIHTQKMESSLRGKILDKIAELYSSSCSRTQIQYFFDSMKEIVHGGLNYIREELNCAHRDNASSDEVLAGVDHMFNSFEKVLEDLGTERKRIEALKKKGDFIPPIEFSVGKIFDKVKRTHDGKKKMSCNATAMLFPLRLTLKKMFESPDVYDRVFSYKKKLENEKIVISNFMQSKLWCRKIKNFKSQQVLPLFLFFDDYETGNALGSHAGSNKLGGVYISLPCFPPEYQSSLSSMLHALLFYSKDRERFGNFAVFRTLIDELTFLETEGVALDLPKGTTTIYFKLGLIIGDNLGLHAMLGFTESFNANYSCRFCKMDRSQRSLATMESETFRRTKKSYQRDLRLDDLSRTGLKGNCIFHSLPDFHVTENLSVDLMHDILEGVCMFDMISIIKHYTSEVKLFTVEELNINMKLHDYGMTDCSNVPPPILDISHLNNGTIKMSAAEMSSFVLHFGVLVGHLIPPGDPVWQVYSILRQILALVTTTRIQPGCSDLLRSLVKEHHRLVLKVLKRNLRPKDHLLVHYGTAMSECGPLVNLWAMRFEAKHKESKQIAISSNSTVNLCKTIATKLQLKLAYQFYTNKIFTLAEKYRSSMHIMLKDLPIRFDSSLEKNVKGLNEKVELLKWIEQNGSTYKPDMVLSVDGNDGGPGFVIIKYIFIYRNVINFIVKNFETIFNSHIYAYEVLNMSKTCRIIRHKHLLCSRPLSVIKTQKKQYIILRSYL